VRIASPRRSDGPTSAGAPASIAKRFDPRLGQLVEQRAHAVVLRVLVRVRDDGHVADRFEPVVAPTAEGPVHVARRLEGRRVLVVDGGLSM
jgi:hypothetical protein